MQVDDWIHHWFSGAQHDIDTADLLLEEYRAFDALFFCHQCVEKMIKGIWVIRRREHPPATTNVLWLVKTLGIEPPDEFFDLLCDLSVVRSRDRWPLEKKTLRKAIKKEDGQARLQLTERMIRWLKETCTT